MSSDHVCRFRRPVPAAFTLVELLVVIGIIAVLLSILMPAISGAWRRSQVMACPIAFCDSSGNVWICDPRGERKMLVSHNPANSGDPRWSPRGDRLAYTVGGNLGVANPVTGKVQLIDHVENPEWVDDNTIVGTRYVGAAGNEMWRVDVRSGKAEPWKRLKAMNESHGHVTSHYQPILTPGFVVAEGDTLYVPKMDVVLRGKDWGRKRSIWTDPDNNTVDFYARIDHMGEWIAWTRGRVPGQTMEMAVAIKRMDDHSSKPPELLGLEYASVIFNDWTPNGHLLVTLRKSEGRVMAVMDRHGRVLWELQSLGVDLHPGTAPGASWRRYERW